MSMAELAKNAKGKNKEDVFVQHVLDEALVSEYFTRSKRKNEDDKWLKENKPSIMSGLGALGKEKTNIGSYQVGYTTPNESKFDMDKVLEYLRDKVTPEMYLNCTKTVVDEEALTSYIEAGEIDIEELQEAAWVTKFGTPRLTVKQVGKGK